MGLSVQLIAQESSRIILSSDVQWQLLNPARGDKSPRAGVLWGNIKSEEPTGFLVKFTDGFSSPPHIHNITYRAVVISGEIHNDDPTAAPMWMSPGSFWTQPKGETHITAARGKNSIALVEIDRGPYLVRPVDKEFDSGEKPINIDSANIVWVNFPGTDLSDNGPKVAYLWADTKNAHTQGKFIKLPAGFKGKILCDEGYFHGVIIKGEPDYLGKENKHMLPGSYFGSEGQTVHGISSHKTKETIIYVRTNSDFKISME